MEHAASSQAGFADPVGHREAHASGVSWAAVIAGAFVAAALSLVLLALGAGFGLESVSPWSNTGASASTVSKASACLAGPDTGRCVGTGRISGGPIAHEMGDSSHGRSVFP